jgi:hypothetical protein
MAEENEPFALEFIRQRHLAVRCLDLELWKFIPN